MYTARLTVDVAYGENIEKAGRIVVGFRTVVEQPSKLKSNMPIVRLKFVVWQPEQRTNFTNLPSSILGGTAGILNCRQRISWKMVLYYITNRQFAKNKQDSVGNIFLARPT